MIEVKVSTHPLVQHKLSLLRDKNTPSYLFRSLLEEITYLLAYEVTLDLPLNEFTVTTPFGEALGKEIATKLVLLPVLRAGLAMLPPFLHLFPVSVVGHLGFYRDEETLKPVKYYMKLPNLSSRDRVIILDPMLATGGTLMAILKELEGKGIREAYFVGIVGSAVGIQALSPFKGQLKIYLCAVDKQLNHKGFIIPGLGDAGDRIFAI